MNYTAALTKARDAARDEALAYFASKGMFSPEDLCGN